MAYLIGTDEAGFGPNLGPLVISATVWQVPDKVQAAALYRLLADVVVAVPHRARNGEPLRVAIADSKALYQPAKGLRHLEAGVLAALGVLGRRPTAWPHIWELLAPDATWRSIPWYANYETALPTTVASEELGPLVSALRTGLAAAGVRFVEMRSRVVFEEEFNELVERHASKSTALSHATLNLVSEMVAPLGREPISVVCDKHGGRNSYHHLLSEHFPEWLITIFGESRERSTYRFGPHDRRMDVAFQMKAESCLPAALASMASKYLRELAMAAFNAFWCGRVPGLQRTAGYPQDARRFKDAIAAVQAELGINDRQLWRSR